MDAAHKPHVWWKKTQKNSTLYDSINVNSQKKQNESVGIEVRIVVASGMKRIDWKGAEKNPLWWWKWSVSDCVVGYTGVYMHQKSPTCMLKICAFNYIVYFNKIWKKNTYLIGLLWGRNEIKYLLVEYLNTLRNDA